MSSLQFSVTIGPNKLNQIHVDLYDVGFESGFDISFLVEMDMLPWEITLALKYSPNI